MTQPQLEGYWFFKWNHTTSLAANIYKFHKLLSAYGSQCRRWEEMHNGSCCVVERVCDTYLMPKIREFANMVRPPVRDVDKTVSAPAADTVDLDASQNDPPSLW